MQGCRLRGPPDAWRWPASETASPPSIVAAIVADTRLATGDLVSEAQPDTQSLATLECLKRNGIRGGYAEYWTAYKLTFLAQEKS